MYRKSLYAIWLISAAAEIGSACGGTLFCALSGSEHAVRHSKANPKRVPAFTRCPIKPSFIRCPCSAAVPALATSGSSGNSVPSKCIQVVPNKYPPAKPGVLHRRVKPWITSARVTSRWYGLPAAKDCYLPPVNGPFRSFPLLAVRLPGLLLTGAGCILLSFYRFSLLYPHSILCTRTPYCDT